MNEQSEQRRPPVFCDLCANLAAAELEGAPLCMTCLLREVSGHEMRADNLRQVAPLRLSTWRDTPVPPAPPIPVRSDRGADPADEAASA